jgi:hypothetical protein
MKLIIAVLAFVIGLAAGLSFAGYAVTHQFSRQATTFDSQERLRASVSLRALDDLQSGHTDQAKSFLAQQIAIYYHSFQQLDASPEKQKLVSHIEASSRSSPELRDALGKTR